MKRKSTGNQLKQSNFVALRMSGFANSTSFAVPSSSPVRPGLARRGAGGSSAYVPVEGCAASLKHKEKNGISTASWQVKCGSSVLSDLGLSTAQIAAFDALFGSDRVQVKDKGSMPNTGPLRQ